MKSVRFLNAMRATLIVGVLLCFLAGCKGREASPRSGGGVTPSSLGEKAAGMLKALDTSESDIKAVAIIELNDLGDSTVYEYMSFRNPSSKPIGNLPGVGSFAAIPYFAVGGRQAEIEWGEYLPNGIERRFTARLQKPVPPGGRVEMILVGEKVAKYKAVKLEDGRWRFGPAAAEVTGLSVGAVLAVKLPSGAHLIDSQPQPDEVRDDPAPLVVWRKALSASKDLKLCVEYRL